MPSIKSDGVWTLISTGADNSERLTREFFGIQYLYMSGLRKKIEPGIGVHASHPQEAPGAALDKAKTAWRKTA